METKNTNKPTHDPNAIRDLVNNPEIQSIELISSCFYLCFGFKRWRFYWKADDIIASIADIIKTCCANPDCPTYKAWNELKEIIIHIQQNQEWHQTKILNKKIDTLRLNFEPLYGEICARNKMAASQLRSEFSNKK